MTHTSPNLPTVSSDTNSAEEFHLENLAPYLIIMAGVTVLTLICYSLYNCVKNQCGNKVGSVICKKNSNLFGNFFAKKKNKFDSIDVEKNKRNYHTFSIQTL